MTARIGLEFCNVIAEGKYCVHTILEQIGAVLLGRLQAEQVSC